MADGDGPFGSMLLTDDHGTWDPVRPADLDKNPLPPVAADGTAECFQCKQRFPFEKLEIAPAGGAVNAYACKPCLLRTAQANTPAIDVENMSLKSNSAGRTMLVIGLIVVAIGIGVAIVMARVA
jgi:hypothetical protein